MKHSNIFQFVEKKSKKKLSSIVATIAVTILLLNICMQMIFINRQNLNDGLINNNNLMILQMFGHSEKENTCFMDANKAENIEHVVFVSESFPLVLNLNDKSGELIMENLTIHRIPKEYGEYVGISDMQEGIIYSSKDGIKNVSQYSLEEEYSLLDVQLKNYENNAPAIFAEEDFAASETFDRLMELVPDKEVYCTPEYIIGVDSTEAVYSVVKQLKQIYADYDAQVFYQAQGLENLVSGSENMLKLQIAIAVFLVVASCGIVSVLLSSVVNSLTPELMVIHINGMSRGKMAKEFYGFLLRLFQKPFLIAEIVSLLIYIIMTTIVFKDTAKMQMFVMVFGINIMVVLVNMLVLRIVIEKRIRNNTANEKISSMLRN